MTRYFCDRCDREVKYPKYIYMPAHPRWCTRLGDNNYQMTTKMLCANCVLSFANWLDDNFIYNEYKEMYKEEFVK